MSGINRTKRRPIMSGPFEISVGDRVRFQNERMAYVVQAANEHFVVCTKPFGLKSTTIHTIIDLVGGFRGHAELIIGLSFSTPTLCREALDRLTNFETNILRISRVTLDIVEIIKKEI